MAGPTEFPFENDDGKNQMGKKRRSKSAIPTTEEARKNSHKLIEQRRRQRINDKIDELRDLLSNSNDGFPNKSSVLETTIDSVKNLRGVCNKLLSQHRSLQEEHHSLIAELRKYGVEEKPLDLNLNESLVAPDLNLDAGDNNPVSNNQIAHSDDEDDEPESAVTYHSQKSETRSSTHTTTSTTTYPFSLSEVPENSPAESRDTYISFSPSQENSIPSGLRMYPPTFPSHHQHYPGQYSPQQPPQNIFSPLLQSPPPLYGNLDTSYGQSRNMTPHSAFHSWNLPPPLIQMQPKQEIHPPPPSQQQRELLNNIMRSNQSLSPAQLASLYNSYNNNNHSLNNANYNTQNNENNNNTHNSGNQQQQQQQSRSQV